MGPTPHVRSSALRKSTDMIAGDIRDRKEQVVGGRGNKGGTSTGNGTEDQGPRVDGFDWDNEI
ncbi:50S ribosomal protein L11 [Sesbania bispinosa]|nr:50S ribosomal protein L11 [Sesbania bispinosa]